MSRFSVSRRRALALLALTSVLLITLDAQDNRAIDQVRDLFATMFSPVQDAVRVVTEPLEDAWRGISNYDEVEAENLRLREELARQEGAYLSALASYRDAQELLALNGIEGLQGIDSVTARVIGESPTNFAQTVEIDRGSDDGLRVGMAVVDTAGLVGRITSVSSDRALVMLVTDAEYAIAVRVVNTPDASDDQAVPDTTPSGLPPGQNTTTSTTTTTTIAPAADPSESTTTTVPTTTTTTTTTLPARPGDPLAPPSVAPPGTTIAPVDLPASERAGFFGRGPRRPPEVEFVREGVRFGSVDVGAIVQTAGGSTSPAPPGIVVGTVERKVLRSSSVGPVLEVRLAARLSDLNFVRVLLYQSAADRGR
jgi:rod shape-determining protein MreC